MVDRVTITIKKDILRRIDSMVDGNDIRNRSHAIENLLTKSLVKTGLDTALIMAGGEGVNLRPITYEIPKPLIPIRGKPILEHQLNLLKKHDVTNVILSVNYMNDKIRGYFGDGRRFGVDITYIEEEKPMGTAGAINLAKDYITKPFLLLNVDTLMNPNIYEMYEFHKKHKKLATVMLTTVSDPSHFGVVKMRGNQILKFVEKPNIKKAPSRLINAGLCVFDQQVAGMVPKRKMMIEELFSRLSREEQLMGFLHDGMTFDVGSAKGYERALKEWRE
ncbi:MAG TPA: sugar phosphate nucleotidyltransferase [archaeon]|nr:sugar phosphate nucleotidyltransferase [archaeon]